MLNETWQLDAEKWASKTIQATIDTQQQHLWVYHQADSNAGLVWSGSPFRVPAARKGDCLATVLQMETYPALSCIRNIGLLRCQPCAETRHVMRKAYCVASGLSMEKTVTF